MRTFLGIGGGPINVAILMFLFSMDIKTASFSSIITILFSQLTKFLTVLIEEGTAGTWFAGYELTVLPWMVAAALVGAFTGSFIKNKLNQKAVTVCFNAMQLMILAVCVYNIVITAAGF